MRKLLEFIRNKKHWFLFFIIEAFAFVILLNNSMYNKAMLLYVNNRVLGAITQFISEYNEYINLKDKNKTLYIKIATLESQYLELKRQFENLQAETNIPIDSTNLNEVSSPKYIPARIININKNQNNIYYVIDKGSNDGLEKDMGVVSINGIVGSIMNMSENYAVVIPIINPLIQISCTVQGRDFIGTLYSDPVNLNKAVLLNVPSHIKLLQGDTVVTSGFSEIFPRGMTIGFVESIQTIALNEEKVGTRYSVTLSTDFNSLSHVYVIASRRSPEIDSLVHKTKNM